MRLPFRSRRLKAGFAAGMTSAGVAAALALVRRRSRRRAEHRNAAFVRASAGIWPAVPTAPSGDVRIAAQRAAPLNEGAADDVDNEEPTATAEGADIHVVDESAAREPRAES